MARSSTALRSTAGRSCRWLTACLVASVVAGLGRADDPTPQPVAAPSLRVLSRQAAVLWALQNNPELMALRQQHGVAAAGILIAETYPFNPVWEARVRYATGPESAGITNVVPTEHLFLLEVEYRHQGSYRRQEAHAALSRTDWDIANQELGFAVRVARAFNGVLYRQRKIQLIDSTIKLNEQAVEQVRKLLGTRFKIADLILAQTEVADVRAQLAPGRLALTTAQFDLRRLLGVVVEGIEVEGDLAPLPGLFDDQRLAEAALQQRPDLRARQAAVSEAEARLRLEVANRFGNATVGPVYELDPTNISMVGVQWAVPLPVLNAHRGLIEQREAERTRAAFDLRQTEIVVRQDVQSALARLQNARAWLDTYHNEVLPNLDKSLETIRKLFMQGEPGVDILRVVDVQRKVLRARDLELDALFEVSQAQADLAAAVADPALVVGPCPVPPIPPAAEVLPPPQP